LEHRIAEIALTLFAVDGLAPLHYAAGLSNTAGRVELGLLRLRTEGGAEGLAFLGSPMRPAGFDARALIEGAAPLLLGQDALARERIGRTLLAWGRSNGLRAVGALDAALWDLAAKQAGLPLHRLLGGFRESIPAYASSPRLSGGAGAYVEQALACKAAGFGGYKIHPPGRPDADLAVCRAVRDAVGPDWPLMLDASFAYRLGDAVRVGLAVQAMGFEWLEDPLGEHDLGAYPELRAKLAIPIMATEMPMQGLESYAPWVANRATDFLRGDVPLKGGVTPMLKAAHLAEAFGLGFEVHHGGNSLNNLAGLHVALAIPNARWFEVLLPVDSHRVGLLRDIAMDAAGHVQPPEGPGLGGVPDMALIARHKAGEMVARR
jgi:L-alanine-DL-glutamate epimerase-like enolase superfamily enzyme